MTTEPMQQYVEALACFDRYYERGWRSEAPLPRFSDGTSQENSIRSVGNFVFVAGLLSGRHAAAFGLPAERREVLRERCVAALRFMTETHVTGTKVCTDGARWGCEWQSSWWAARMALGARLLGESIGADSAAAVERVVTAEADRHLDRTPPSGLVGDTKAEENAWDCEVLAAAVAMYPSHKRAARWRLKLTEFGVNTLSVAADADDGTVYEGKPVREWHCSVNLHPDFTIENHGACHFCYVASPLHSLAWSYCAFVEAGQEAPAALLHHVKDVWEGTKHTFMDNRFAYIAGQDWARYTYGSYFIVPVLVLLQSLYGDGDAAYIERRRVERFRLEQTMSGDGSFFGKRLSHGRMSGHPVKYETDCFANLGLAWLLHERLRPVVAAPDAGSFKRRISGKRVSHSTLTASARSARVFASFSWQTLFTSEPMMLFVPDGMDDATEWMPGNLVGRATVQQKTRPLFVQSMRETPTGFRVEGIQSEKDRRGWALDREIRLDVNVEAGVAEIEFLARSRRQQWIRLTEGMSLHLPNDIFNGEKRTIVGDRGELTFERLEAPPSKKRRGGRVRRLARELMPAERTTRCGDRWINIENKLGIVNLSDERGFWYVQQVGSASDVGLHCDRISSVPARRWFRAKKGEVIVRTHLRLLAGDAVQTRRAAESGRGADWFVVKREDGAAAVTTEAREGVPA